MRAGIASHYPNFWNIPESLAEWSCLVRGVIRQLRGNGTSFQVGCRPWFGTEDAMDDHMPWGRGMVTPRPGGESPSSSNGPEGHEPLPPRSLPFYHQPVLLSEVLEYLQPGPGKLMFDGTLGGGGHTAAMLEQGARVVSMDKDDQALQYAAERLKPFGERFCALRGDFRRFPEILAETGVQGFDGMLVDIGVSSHQLDDAERGFSFMRDGPLDLRMDRSSGQSAADWLQTVSAEEMERAFRDYGEEPRARRIAQAIVNARKHKPLQRTLQLAELIATVNPKHGPRNPATLVFQALRIVVNDELGALHDFLAAAPRWLKPNGRLAVISFHSLEDRIVKQTFQHLSKPFLDRPEWPEPRPNPECVLRLLTKKPVEGSPAEVLANPRARSARLRVAERLPTP